MNRQAILAIAVLGGAILIAVVMVLLRPQPEEQARVEQAPLVETVKLCVACAAVHPALQAVLSNSVRGSAPAFANFCASVKAVQTAFAASHRKSQFVLLVS